MPTNKKKKGKARAKAKSPGESSEVNVKEFLDKINALSISGRDKFEKKPPPDASCWICLEDGPDEGGQPIRRGCSCRNDAGFAHISCIVTYSKKRYAKILNGRGMDGYTCREPWTQCVNCKQDYTRYVAVDMAAEYVRNSEGDPGGIHSTIAKLVLLYALLDTDVDALEEGKELNEDVLSVLNRGSFAHARNKRTATVLEAEALTTLGNSLMRIERNKADFAKGVELLKRACDLEKRIGNADNVQAIEERIKRFQATMYGGSDACDTAKLEMHRLEKQYKEHIRRFGKGHRTTIDTASLLMVARGSFGSFFKSYDLLKETLVLSRRVLGSDHDTTILLEEKAKLFQAGWPAVVLPKETKLSAIKVDVSNDGMNTCTVSTSGNDSRIMSTIATGFQEDSSSYLVNKNHGSASVSPSQLIVLPIAPVTLVGLKGAAHHNGKRGVIRGWNQKKERYVIELEEEEKSLLVKPDNARIAFFPDTI